MSTSPGISTRGGRWLRWCPTARSAVTAHPCGRSWLGAPQTPNANMASEVNTAQRGRGKSLTFRKRVIPRLCMFRDVRWPAITDTMAKFGFASGAAAFVVVGLFRSHPQDLDLAVAAAILMGGLGASLGFWQALARDRTRSAA